MPATIPERRLAGQLLAGRRPSDPVAVVERMLAVQAQDGRGARLAVRARSEGLTAGDVDRALTHDRSLVVTWLNRGTLHLVRSEDYPWLQLLTAPRLATGIARRLAQEGVTPGDAERGVSAIARTLADEGPLDRHGLRERLAASGVPARGGALIQLLALASIRGLVVRGPMTGKQHAFVLVRDWLGEQRPVDRDRALAELARRYLAAHGPADARDLAYWAGVALRDARAGLDAIASELAECDGLVDLRRAGGEVPRAEPRLLGPWEPVLLGWSSRRPIVDEHEARLVNGGVFRRFALVNGRAAATWTISGEGLELEPFGRLARADRAALEADARDVGRFFGA